MRAANREAPVRAYTDLESGHVYEEPLPPVASFYDVVYVGIWARPRANHLIRLIRKARDRVWGADA